MADTVLRDERREGDSRYLGIRLGAGGELVIEGQDLGDGVEELFGAGYREYEWIQVVAAPDVPALLELLGVTAQGDVLGAMAARYAGPGAHEFTTIVNASGLARMDFNRVGD